MIYLTCITCPIGCRLEVKKLGDKIEVYNNKCSRGEKYAIEELLNPKRVLPTTVKINNGYLKRLPVKTNKPIPKDKIFDCMKEINKVNVDAPVKIGDIIIKNILNLGVDVVATKSVIIKK